jgi:hypothetical protein
MPMICSDLRDFTRLEGSSDRLVYTFCEVTNVVLVESSHRYSSVGGHKDMGLFCQCLRLFRAQAGKAGETYVN